MGSLQAKDGTRYALWSVTMIGRSRGSTILIDDDAISRNHARVFWLRGQWMVRDLGSRNGTTLDGQEVPSGLDQALRPGAVLGVGGVRLELVDNSAPVARAVCGGRVIVGTERLLPLGETLSLVFEGKWVVRDGDDEREWTGGAIECEGAVWTLDLPEYAPPTCPVTPRVSTLRLRFLVPTCEEGIELRLGGPGISLQLGRSYVEVLYRLAEARVADREEPSELQGWRDVDEIARAVGATRDRVNLAIHRVRADLDAAGVRGAKDIVERLQRSGQLRLGVDPDRITWIRGGGVTRQVHTLSFTTFQGTRVANDDRFARERPRSWR